MDWVLALTICGGALLAGWLLRPTDRGHGPFPEAWRALLRQQVSYYNALPPEEQARFEQRVQQFLARQTIVGVDAVVDDEVRVLVAASAVIPALGFPDFYYRNLGEILIYPNVFHHNLGQEGGPERALGGMAGSSRYYHAVVLALPLLKRGFQFPHDHRNVGIHEFVHVLDRQDGAVDGSPDLLGRRPLLQEWQALVQEEMTAIALGHSDLEPYAGTNPAEFIAVMAEYFFEQPEYLALHHPKLYKLLTQIFNQDPQALFRTAINAQQAKRPRAETRPPALA